jgi:hypothetical protein
MEEGLADAPDFEAVLGAWFETSWLGVAMRDSTFLYPLVNVAHLLGLVLIVSGIGLLDLRLLRFARQVPLQAVYAPLTRVAVLGVVLQLATGTALFASDAIALMQNDIFGLKMQLLAVALANAAAFRLLWQRRIADWDSRPPFFGRVQAAFSLMLWLSIGTLGRLIAYA